MDGTFTTCRTTPECTRLDGHDDACNVPVVMRRRGLASRLRYLARKLEDGERRQTISSALRALADELP